MEQIKENTVSARGQLKESEFVSFLNVQGTGKRILFVGNSITRHGVLTSIGWHNDWGMAASSADKDYVHIVSAQVKKTFKDSAFCICQVAEWERQYKTGKEILSKYKTARDFDADIIIMRCIENCPQDDFDHHAFREQYKILIDYLNSSKNAEVILTSGFWKNVGDVDIERIAKESGYKYIYLGDLGEDDDMKAIGRFEHNGVAHPPGDKGMREIANRILLELL